MLRLNLLHVTTANMHDNPAPVFRSATPDDVAPILRLLEQSQLPVDGVEALLANDASQFVVAHTSTDAHEIVAVAGIEVCCDNAVLRSVAVRTDWQRAGLGHQLVERAVSEAEARGIHALYLLTLTAEDYFPRFGFTTIGRDAVPADIAASAEFRSICPASAIAMTKPLSIV